MAIKGQAQKRSKKIIFHVLLILLVGWVILLGWALSIWWLSGFDYSRKTLDDLSKQQATAVAEFPELAMIRYLPSWFTTLETEKITTQITHATHLVKSELKAVLTEDHLALSNMSDEWFGTTKQIWLLIRLTVQVLWIKLVILLTAIPLFALAMTTGLVDGLNQRAIRTASLGRESSYVFHQVNRYFKHTLLMLLALWLAVPVSISPAWMFVPISILLSVMVCITASRFKKYW